MYSVERPIWSRVLAVAKLEDRALPKSLQGTPWTSGPADVVTDAIAKGANRSINSGATLTDLAGETSTALVDGAEYASGIGEAKLIYDGVTFFGGLAGCSLGIF